MITIIHKTIQQFSKKILLPAIFTIIFLGTVQAQNAHAKTPEPPAIEGRWDLTVDMDGTPRPSWLEVKHSGLGRLVGYYVGTGGSARPVSKVNFKDGKFNFSLPPQWEPQNTDVQVEGILADNKLTGTITNPDGKTHSFSGVKAPSLKREGAVVWGKPITLFNGKDLTGWHAEGPNQWYAENGILRSPRGGSNLVTDEKFTDFKLHIEFRYPEGSNSGVYLRGRYEVQVADSKGLEPASDQLGGIYGFITPLENVAKAPGEWQSYDVTLVGRLVTVVANGKTIIYNQIIPGITGGALNSNEAEPGPIYIQGDHGAIDYRNIVITPAK